MKALVLVAVVMGACEGPMGLDGPRGPTGPTGPQGIAGESGLQRTHLCQGFADLGGGRGYALDHTVYDFADGSVLATCTVAGGIESWSSTRMYRAGQIGALTGGCSVTADVDTNSSGYWTFDITPSKSASTVVYNDVGSAYDRRSQSVTCTQF